MIVKNVMDAVHLPNTKAMDPIGAVIIVSRVPSLLSSANERIVRKGTNAGAPNINPITKEARGGRIQSVAAKPSMKNLNPTPNRAKK